MSTFATRFFAAFESLGRIDENPGQGKVRMKRDKARRDAVRSIMNQPLESVFREAFLKKAARGPR
ncbi:hypothetical protein RISK_000948 [Rhodopirellula islandica]|uniref:Uncharacterized protein n=1 Tax=Rhodopirellula islandica TaxID=595434 RepID=A0A0J1BKW5_RHOIS|nr:hypothetical protein RISK_000948 [Rhodopirellula islandica]